MAYMSQCVIQFHWRNHFNWWLWLDVMPAWMCHRDASSGCIIRMYHQDIYIYIYIPAGCIIRMYHQNANPSAMYVQCMCMHVCTGSNDLHTQLKKHFNLQLQVDLSWMDKKRKFYGGSRQQLNWYGNDDAASSTAVKRVKRHDDRHEGTKANPFYF